MRLKDEYNRLATLYQTKVTECTAKSSTLTTVTNRCTQRQAEWKVQNTTCKNYDDDRCIVDTELVDESQAICRAYKRCYQEKKDAYDALVATTKANETKRLKEW